jgi:hypothetical protein
MAGALCMSNGCVIHAADDPVVAQLAERAEAASAAFLDDE